MRSDDELDKETDRFVTRLWILGISIFVLAAAGIFAGIKYYINSDTAEAASVYHEEVPIDKLKVKAEILRHNFPLEHPKYHVEKKDGVEYWFCDDEHCSMYLAISDDLQIMASGYPQLTDCNKHLFVEE